MIEESFTMLSKGFDAITDEGYIVKVDDVNLFSNTQPRIFYKNNPHTIYNIKHYLKIHNSDTRLLSNIYNGNTDILDWKCSCGAIFHKSWYNFKDGSLKCYDCSIKERTKSKQISIEKIEQYANKLGLHFYGDKPNNLNDEALNLVDDEGFYYSALWSNIYQNHKPKKFSTNNKYTIKNINTFLANERNDEYYVLDNQEYINNTSPLLVKHRKCNKIFRASWAALKGKVGSDAKRRYYKQCPYCSTYHIESFHASVLKQIFIHEYPGTSLEDRSCINPSTNRVLPTDIVNHNLKIAIEIQSGYHDDVEQIKIDKFKKSFWINNGYKFYDPDIRDYSILEMINLFFKDISSIPEYVTFDFSASIDFNLVQKYLDEGYSIKEISNITGYTIGGINSLSATKKIKLPEDYMEKFLNKKSIVMLSKNGDFIKRFDSKCDADRNGYKYGTVSRVLFGKQKYAYDCLWVFEKDYINGNFVIPELEKDKYDIEIDSYDIHDNFLKHYNNIYEASNDLSIYKYEIFNIINGKGKSIRNYKFKISA